MCRTKHAGRDIVTKENSTHIEHQTRHVYVKEGWNLFKIDNIAGSSSGVSGIGLVGEVLLFFLFLGILLWLAKRCMAGRIRHSAYKAFYKSTTANTSAPRFPALTYVPAQDAVTAEYGPRTTRSRPDDDARVNMNSHVSRSPRVSSVANI